MSLSSRHAMYNRDDYVKWNPKAEREKAKQNVKAVVHSAVVIDYHRGRR